MATHEKSRHEKLIFVDLETTGANPIVDRITEIGIVEVQGEQVTHWSTLVNPQVPIPPFIQGLTGISDAMVATAPTFGALAEEVLARLQGGLFIAHNARFDYGFLRNAFKAAGHSLRADVLCTVKLSRKLFPEHAKHNLDALVQRHQLQALGRHRALADADLLLQFWRTLERDVAPETFSAALAQLLQRPSTPTHLAPEVLDEMPDTPGVYLFYGENDALLYVGKSVRLRQRVLSHFNGDHRLFQDMRMSQQIHRLEWRETGGELGALLLEAQLIKDRQPIHNRVLRRQRELCAWQLPAPDDTGQAPPMLAYARDVDFAATESLYGLFSSRKKAEASLREIAESHQLCLVMLGLENRVQAGKPCFAHQLRRCHGACCGKEPQALHHARLMAALAGLKLTTWPYPGPVALIEGTPGNTRQQAHVVHNWCYLGSADAEEDVWTLLEQSPARPAFDVDTYKILLRALRQGKVKVRPLPRRPEPAAA